MKIQLMSDLHLEFQAWRPPETEADVVVLAGDIHTKGRAIKWAVETFTQPVIFVPGNHDYWKGSLGNTLKKMQAEAAGTNVHVLHNSEVLIDNVRFIGGTLWTDYNLTGNQPIAMLDAQARMRDFKKIRTTTFGKLRPAALQAEHAVTRSFIERKLAEPFSGKTVVVTHHAPCELSIHEYYKDEKTQLNSSYASRLDRLMDDGQLWLHGHTHHSFDYEVCGARVMCNPRGYAPDDLNPSFNDSLILEV